MGTFGGSQIVVSTFSASTIAGAGTLTVGNQTVTQTARTGSGVHTDITQAATDIDNPDPGDWYDLIDISSGPYWVYFTTNITIGLDSGETAGDAIRCQILIDGSTAADVKATKAGSDEGAVIYCPTYYGFSCNTSFKIRFARQGDLANADSKIDAFTVYYWGI